MSAVKENVEKSKPSIVQKIGFTELELRAKHDTMFKIRQAVKQLRSGLYLTDQQMREQCKVSTGVWRGYAEHAEFEKYRLKFTDVTYWGTQECIAKLREDLNVT